MKQSFEDLVQMIKKNREKCPWSKEQEIEQHVHELISEANEVLEAVNNKDNENLKEELGDILFDTLFMCIIAEEKGMFKITEVIDNTKQKMIRRKPWVFGDEKIETKEDAVRRWKEIKQEEKNDKKSK